MENFDEVWPILVQRAQELNTVETFGQGNQNDVRYEADQDQICFNSRATEKEYWTQIPRKHWKTAWEELQRTGELEPRRFFELTSVRRGSTAVPFLQRALQLPVDSEERIVYLP